MNSEPDLVGRMKDALPHPVVTAVMVVVMLRDDGEQYVRLAYPEDLAPDGVLRLLGWAQERIALELVGAEKPN